MQKPDLKTVEVMFKDKKLTFEDIQKLNYNQFNTGFQPSDLLGEDQEPVDDEILTKLRNRAKMDKKQLKIRGDDYTKH